MGDRPVHLAQYNIARARADLDDLVMAGFVSDLKRINELADSSPGFVWRLKTDKGDATEIRPYEDRLLLVTLSVWESLDHLKRFVYRGDHADLLRRRAQWFTEPEGDALVLWWIPGHHIPEVAEGKERLEYLRHHGPTTWAFTFRRAFAPPPESPHPGFQLDASSLQDGD